MNKQEVIDELENAIPDFILNDFQRGKETGLTYALELVEELDEPKKPVLNKYEAEWIEGLKKEQELRPFCTRNSMLYFITRCGFGYGFSYDHKGEEVELTHYHHDSHVERERLMNAFLYGYEVEKEKLYTVELPNPNSPEHFVLRKNGVNKIVADCYLSDNWKLYKNTWLTESEIKKDFEWAWQLAKEVEE